MDPQGFVNHRLKPTDLQNLFFKTDSKDWCEDKEWNHGSIQSIKEMLMGHIFPVCKGGFSTDGASGLLKRSWSGWNITALFPIMDLSCNGMNLIQWSWSSLCYSFCGLLCVVWGGRGGNPGSLSFYLAWEETVWRFAWPSEGGQGEGKLRVGSGRRMYVFIQVLNTPPPKTQKKTDK